MSVEEGMANRDEALERVGQDQPDRSELIAELIAFATTTAFLFGKASGDDVTEYLDSIGYDGDYRIIGKVFNRNAWKPAGYTPSRVARRNARPIMEWTLA